MSGLFVANPFGILPDGRGSLAPYPNLIQPVMEEDETGTLTSPTTTSHGSLGSPRPVHSMPTSFRAPFGADSAADDPVLAHHPILSSYHSSATPPTSHLARNSPANSDGYPDKYNFSRRSSVSAESIKPSADTNDNWTPPVHPKSADQLERLHKAIEGNFLFSHLDDEQRAQILGALVEKLIPAKGIKVISQGDIGDFFYIVERGSFDVYIHPTGCLQPGPDGMGSIVAHIPAGGSFGELALMYNATRAATVTSAEPTCTLWALDRVTFRRILMESTFAQRRMYEEFLSEVPLLASLASYERSKIADALKTEKFGPGELIIREGDLGQAFYLLESGEADAYKGEATTMVKHYKKGDFFGELALLNDVPRAAGVVAATDVKVASLGKSAFQRLLGPVEDIMRRTRYVGIETGVEEMDPLQAA